MTVFDRAKTMKPAATSKVGSARKDAEYSPKTERDNFKRVHGAAAAFSPSHPRASDYLTALGRAIRKFR